MICSDPYIKVESGLETAFPCGKCEECKINKARQWKNRILLESLVHAENAFLTLTYDEENLPVDGCVDKREVQLYLKRLRKSIEPFRIRYFAVGEYGSKSWRPHYHLVVFGLKDANLFEECWKKGFTFTGDLSAESAGYVTGYVTKGLTDKKNEELLRRGLKPEFMTCSRRSPGGLGIEAIEEIGLRLKNNRFKNKKTIRSVGLGRHEMPLGRYLTEKIVFFGDLDVRQYNIEWWDLQEKRFQENFMKGGFRKSTVKEEEVKRNSGRKRRKMFPKKRCI